MNSCLPTSLEETLQVQHQTISLYSCWGVPVSSFGKQIVNVNSCFASIFIPRFLSLMWFLVGRRWLEHTLEEVSLLYLSCWTTGSYRNSLLPLKVQSSITRYTGWGWLVSMYHCSTQTSLTHYFLIFLVIFVTFIMF